MSGRQVDRGRLADVVLAAVVGALGTAVAAFDDDTTALDLVLVVLASAALAFHRAAPRAVLAAATVLGTAYVVHAHPGPLSALPVLGAVHTAADRKSVV